MLFNFVVGGTIDRNDADKMIKGNKIVLLSAINGDTRWLWKPFGIGWKNKNFLFSRMLARPKCHKAFENLYEKICRKKFSLAIRVQSSVSNLSEINLH